MGHTNKPLMPLSVCLSIHHCHLYHDMLHQRDSWRRQYMELEGESMETAGLLADVCDVLFDDEERAAEHGYDGVLERAQILVQHEKEGGPY